MTTHPILGQLAPVESLGRATLEAINASGGCSISAELAGINARALEIASDPVRASITLTCEQIMQLAKFAGMSVDCESDTLESAYVICEGDALSVHNVGEPSDPDSISYYSHVAYSEEYPEEGCVGLGAELPAPAMLAERAKERT